MTAYWLIFLAAAAFALRSRVYFTAPIQGIRPPQRNLTWLAIGMVLTLFIGYRFEVGGDWDSYLRHLRDARYQDFYQAVAKGDPGYRLLNLLSVRMNWGIAGVNMVSALLFSYGLVIFCRALPRPFLALAVAIPYLVIVVAMGYTRQGVALGLAMAGLVTLSRNENRWFVFLVLCAATFHKSAVLLLPIAALAATRNKYWTALWVGVVSLGAYFIFLDRSVDELYSNYVEARYQSQGAIIRAAMNTVPACLYLAFSKRFHMHPAEANLWRWFSIISIALLLTAISTSATTAVDRIALYMLPLQLVIFSHLPDVLGQKNGQNRSITALILIYYTTVLFVWLNFATHARYWIPYRFYPQEAWF